MLSIDFFSLRLARNLFTCKVQQTESVGKFLNKLLSKVGTFNCYKLVKYSCVQNKSLY